MNATLDAVLRSWPSEPWLVFTLLLTAGIYLRGWHQCSHRDRGRWSIARLAAFTGGLLALFLALASPIEPFAELLLQVHMAQHLLLMMVAPPLLWLGAPFFPLLRGLPSLIRSHWIAPFLRLPALRRAFQLLTQPVPALALFTATTWFWHLPSPYELALGSGGWHYVQHVCFLAAALLFWYPVIRPYPSRPRWSPWLLIPYLLVADVQNTLLSALLTFSDRPLYPHYTQVPRLGNLSPLEDQAAAGVLMWVPGSVAFLFPLFWIGIKLLYGDSHFAPVLGVAVSSRSPLAPVLGGEGSGVRGQASRIPLPVLSFPANSKDKHADLLHLPLVGPFLRWQHARPSLQILLFGLATFLILDGLCGPQVAPLNLAGVLPWIHWRGFVILSLLVMGNFFCMACPFVLPRTIARRWLPQGRSWPRWLRSKWLAVCLLAIFFWAYEAFAIWDSPWWTAWLAVSYFGAAFVIDGVFRGAAFCKYVCPIGQFNFVQSLMSPWEIRVRDPAVCITCTTKDCIRGQNHIPGCELALFQPRKASNMDCTFCLDCIHACPHENIGIRAVLPGKELWHDRLRSGLGRFSRRPDLAALILVLVFGAFANAAGMIAPMAEWETELASWLRLRSPLLVTSLAYVLGLVIVPILLVGSAAALSRRLGRFALSSPAVATRFAFALVPLGFSMWLAHYSFHLLTGYDALIPVLQRLANQFGSSLLGEPDWACACCRPVADWLPRLEILFLDFGLLLSLYTAYRISLTQCGGTARAWRAAAPWAFLIVLLFGTGVWIVLQPMQMRGTLFAMG
jgi:cytochrome c oxidase assembly factor CtaG/polyferredoxin